MVGPISPAHSGEVFLGIVETAAEGELGPSEGRDRQAEDPAGPRAGLQRLLLDEGGRRQRIIASDPAYAAMVAAFYVSTAALGATRR